jgi:transposase
MSAKERDRLQIIKELTKDTMTRKEAADLLEMSERNVYRILSRYNQQGDRAVIHQLRGRSSNRGYPDAIKKDVFALHRGLYADYGPTLFAEMLIEHHHYAIDHDTIRRWFREEHIAIPTSRKARKHRRKRERRSAIGELVQFDGSPHDWFEGRGPECCLLHAIDDASNRVFLRFAPSENSLDVMKALWQYVERYGIPRSLYTDHGSVYYAENKLTDVGCAMKQLGVKMIFANSAQAKGRVERGNRTHQDRLIKKLRREGIGTICAANRFLDEQYLDEHNQKFANPDGLADLHRSVEGYDLKNIFCFQQLRQVHNDYTITLEGTYVQLERSDVPLPPPRQYVTVRRYLDGSLHIFWQEEQELLFTILPKRPSVKHCKPRLSPPAAHPWRLKNYGISTKSSHAVR